MKKVQVLLSSYNGAVYIKEQLDSILAQEEVQVSLLIRDDGSRDGTREILAHYQEQYENIQVYYGENQGVISSFFTLLTLVGEEADYVALADQDDVWLPQKLLRAVERLEETIHRQEKSMAEQPLVYCSAVQLVNEQLQPLPKAISYKKIRPVFGNALVENICTGCTCVINRTMLQLVKEKTPTFTIMHDFWIYLVGSCFGTVIYEEKSFILYRQHEHNTLGATSNFWETYRRRIRNFKKHRGQLSRQAEELLRLYGEQMPKEKKQLAEALVQTRNNSLTRKEVLKTKNGKKKELYKTSKQVRWELLNNDSIFRQRKSDDRIMKLFLLLGFL